MTYSARRTASPGISLTDSCDRPVPADHRWQRTPVVAFTLKPEVTNYTVFDVSARLREFGWLVPAYTFPANREDLSVLRVVVRAGLTNDMADLFLADMRKQTLWLESLEGAMPKRGAERATASTLAGSVPSAG